MIELFNEASELQRLLESDGWEFFFVGGLALQIWGEPRLTTDIDLTVFTDLQNETQKVERLLDLIESRFSSKEAASEFSKTARILLLKSSSGTEIDMMLGGLADMSSDLARSSIQRFTPEISLRVCSAETLICLKTVAGRLKDFADLETVLIKQTDLDWEYIDQYLAEVAEYKDLTENTAILRRLKAESYRP